ncbi:MAG: phage baseplate protein [Clostridia bacterium]|nr:phage baseplate protein [Clostridia bacterium]
MRKFYLHTADKTSSFDLNAVTAFAANPSGLGNAFDISYKQSEKGNHPTNVKPSFEPIVLQIYFNGDGTVGYRNYKNLLQFLATCGKSVFLFEYDDGVTDKYCDVIFKSATKSERTEEGAFCETFTFERQSYWYEQVEESFDLKNSDPDPTFPLSFPFGFVGLSFINEVRIKNSFFADAPIHIKISGYVERDINVYIKTVDTDETVAEIQLSCGNIDGQTITINPSDKKITVTDAHGNETNGYGLTDKTKQSFLYLPQGVYNIGANIANTDSGKIELSIKRYLLD